MGGHTTGVWIPEDSDLLDRFDAIYGEHERSAAIRGAMELQIDVDRILAEQDLEFSSQREKRHFVRQCLLDGIRDRVDD